MELKPLNTARLRAAVLGTAALVLAFAAPAEAKGRYKDGEFVGQVADTEWGAVQVQAIIRDGSLTDIRFVQYPSHRRRSVEISNYALPVLRSEAIQAQSARVDIVSRATMTAEGFQQSLSTALGQAAN